MGTRFRRDLTGSSGDFARPVPGVSSAVEFSSAARSCRAEMRVDKEKGRLAGAGGLRILDGRVLPLSVVEDRCRLASGVIDSLQRRTDDPREAVIGGVQFEHGRPFRELMT
jgi:hypothetical protein